MTADNPTTRIARALATAPERFLTLGQLEAVVRAEGDVRDGDRWGRWIYRPGTRALYIQPYGNGGEYEVDLGRCRTPSDVLDWVSHISMKTWATDADVGALVRALLTLNGHAR